MTGTGAPAGWYPDPAGAGGQRFWDGSEWTAHVVPPAPPVLPPPPVYGSPHWATPAPARHNGLAVASLVCSIAGIFFLSVPSVLGVIFGFVARSQIRRSNGTQAGDGLALAGVIVGFCAIGFWLLITVLPMTHN